MGWFPCCGCNLCPDCTRRWALSYSGFANAVCQDCGSFAGTRIIDRLTTNDRQRPVGASETLKEQLCVWSNPFETECGGVPVELLMAVLLRKREDETTVRIQATIQTKFLQGDPRFSSCAFVTTRDAEEFRCSEIADLVLPFSTCFRFGFSPPDVCDFSTGRVTLTALKAA